MFRFAKRSKLLIATLCVAIFALRVAGLHAHLCLDGSEPPLSIHTADSGIHHLDEAGAAGQHADRDVPIASDVLVKKPTGDLDLSLLAAFCALLLFVLTRPREPFAFLSEPARFRSARTRLRPPLRGPPLPA
jgi:hypothetical protein